MPLVPYLQGKTVAVMGLGKSGTSAATVLQNSGATVWAWDDKAETRDAAAAAGLTIVDLTTADLTEVALVLWSPGIPHTHPQPHPVATRARALGKKLVCDIELLALACPSAHFIGITGTNGKSTTTTLIGHILTKAGRKVAIGGNLGIPALDLPPLGTDGTYVLELSSYQLELIDQAAFDVALLLNITPDHLGRHGGMDGYIAAKAGLFGRLRPGGIAVIGIDDAPSRSVIEHLRNASGEYAIAISTETQVMGGVCAVEGILVDDCDGQATPIINLRGIASLPGRHNWQNACAAYAAARASDVDIEAICKGLSTYPGLAHRQELVGVIDGVRYVNDSKATNADACEKAMVCYDDIYWIIGGQPKEGGIASLDYLYPRIRRAFLIGDATEDFAASLQGKAPFERCGTLDVAVARARETAVAERRPGAVVLLSPACASWDQFKSFEHRGDVFRALVAALPGERRPA
ncbi:MAG TPA: UDP-N-acetylmuramoyl-L-alanine--D-glutamate ligase [Patescibacteria group bacterium]|nr:UDP-N-acetylmuramoyl-L-alanine--D-glutamate ligase [Patescibacteria group bacterium]